MPSTAPQPTYTRDVRLGLVLFGGVSLAVYENGIAQELYRAVRGLGPYALLAKLIDSNLLVDIISGTSAGGINGLMLGFCLANDRRFESSADLWRKYGNIDKLLRVENDPNASSLLDSQYYQDRLNECFENFEKLAPPEAAATSPIDSTQGGLKDKQPSYADEIDVFITSTDANGALSTVFDDLGHSIDLKDHRALFKLAYRGPRKNDFAVSSATMAKLARMTSCFPVAFEPVRVTAVDKEIQRWGKLSADAVFLDGGLLANKPFTSTIDAIASRTAVREVDRFLIYVEPNPEQFKPVKRAEPASPAMAQAALAALVSIPGYQSIAADLQAVGAHNDRAARLVELIESLGPPPATTMECLEASGVWPPPTTCNIDAYITGRLVQVRDAAVECLLNTTKGREYMPVKEIKETAPGPEASAQSASDTPPGEAEAATKNVRRSARILVESFNRRKPPAKDDSQHDSWLRDPEERLTRYDIFYRVRRVTHLSRALMRSIKNDGASVPEAVWEVVNHAFKMHEIVQWAMTTALTAQPIDWQSISQNYVNLDCETGTHRKDCLEEIESAQWASVRDRLNALLDAGTPLPVRSSEPLLLRDARTRFYEALKLLTPELQGLPRTPREGNPENLLARLDRDLKDALRELCDESDSVTRSAGVLLRDEFCRFHEVDRQIFLLLLGSGFESTQPIRVVRFSPLDAQRALSAGEVADKVRGKTLFAFGGFLKQGWRANDLLMGRLDAACQLTECLLTKERLATMRLRQPAGITASDVLAAFPDPADGEVFRLTTLVNGYLAKTQPGEDDWQALIDSIVGAMHDRIFREEWPHVAESTLDQEAAWGQYRQAQKPPSKRQVPAVSPPQPAKPYVKPPPLYDPDALVWKRAKERPDQVLVRIARDSLATLAKTVKPFPPGDLGGNLFNEEIPSTIMKELGALVLIRLTKGLLDSIPKDSRGNPSKLRLGIENSRLFSLPFEILLPLAYRWFRSLRLDPALVTIVNTIVPTAVVTAYVLVGLLYYYGHIHLGWWGLALATGLPLLILAVWATLFWVADTLRTKR